MSIRKANGLGLCIIVFFCWTASQSCLIEKVKNCTDYPLLKRIDFHAHIPTPVLETTCQRLQKGLSCIYATGRLDQCHPSYSWPFVAQEGVVNAVCGKRREEYLRSSLCFNKDGVKTQIAKDCFSLLVNYAMLQLKPCQTLKMVLNCARTKIIMTEGCGEADAFLMVDLVEIYLRPTSEAFKCYNAVKMIHATPPQLRDETQKSGTFKTPLDIIPPQLRDESDRRGTFKTSQPMSTSQEPRLEESTRISPHMELYPRESETITKQETPTPDLQTFPMRINEEDSDAEPEIFFETARSDVHEQISVSTYTFTEPPTSSQHPLNQQLKDAESSSSSRSTQSLSPVQTGSRSTKTGIIQSERKNPISSNYNHMLTSMNSTEAREPQDANRTYKNQHTGGLEQVITRLARNEASARVSMSTQGSSAGPGSCAAVQALLLLLNVVILF
jgi:hypothetical protein